MLDSGRLDRRELLFHRGGTEGVYVLIRQNGHSYCGFYRGATQSVRDADCKVVSTHPFASVSAACRHFLKLYGSSFRVDPQVIQRVSGRRPDADVWIPDVEELLESSYALRLSVEVLHQMLLGGTTRAAAEKMVSGLISLTLEEVGNEIASQGLNVHSKPIEGA